MDFILDSIPSLVSHQNIDFLMMDFSLDKLHSIVFSMAPDKAPSPDGFTILFFQECWDFIRFDLLMELEESRRGGYILKNFNITYIALIPKSKNPQTFAEFRPISL